MYVPAIIKKTTIILCQILVFYHNLGKEETCQEFYWSFIRKTYGDAHSKMGKVSNLVNGPILWNVPPAVLTSDGNFGKSTFPCTVQ